MPDSSPQVDVCVLGMNNSDVTAFFMRHFVATTKGVPYKLWFLDQASTDRTPGVMAWWKANTRRWVPWARYRKVDYRGFRADENMGFAAGNNFLAAMGKAPWILFVNNDAFPRKDDDGWLSRMIATADEQGWAAVGPTSNRVMGLQDMKWDDGWPKAHDLKVVSGMCVLIRREVFEETGWDTDFMNGDEDCALSLELRRAGHRIGCDRSVYFQHLCNTTMLDWCAERKETVKEHFYHTRQQLIAKFGVFFVRDLWEWESLRTPKEDWNKLGVNKHGFLWHPPGKPEDTAASQGKLLARLGRSAQGAPRKLRPREDVGRGQAAGGSQGRAEAVQRATAETRRHTRGDAPGGTVRPRRAGPRRARSAISLRCEDLRSEEYAGPPGRAGQCAGADTASAGREGASSDEAGRDTDGFEYHFAGGPLGFAHAVRREGTPCPFDEGGFTCACQTKEEILAGV